MTKLGLVSAILTTSLLCCRNPPGQQTPPNATPAVLAARVGPRWAEPTGFRLDLRVPIELPSDPGSPPKPERTAISEWWARDIDGHRAECLFVSDADDEPQDPFLPDGGVLRTGDPFLFFGTSGQRQGLREPEHVKLRNGRAVFASYEGSSLHECRVKGTPPNHDVRALLFWVDCDAPATTATGFWLRLVPDAGSVAQPSPAELIKLLHLCD